MGNLSAIILRRLLNLRLISSFLKRGDLNHTLSVCCRAMRPPRALGIIHLLSSLLVFQTFSQAYRLGLQRGYRTLVVVPSQGDHRIGTDDAREIHSAAPC